eukprot:CAMPEP_0115044208 /NCGR_PEP_ID=MMETSP0216-20121206/47335_1 /TAXON_ID=223996 /ORGANISM="Protocruzia adherens, Strain Boccale" /LENGTH=282 /DNA_ID=CAMNT_0002426691 /DNA_START=206 /DNA_END=1054 /DNA_ORIENTATION=+
MYPKGWDTVILQGREKSNYICLDQPCDIYINIDQTTFTEINTKTLVQEVTDLTISTSTESIGSAGVMRFGAFLGDVSIKNSLITRLFADLNFDSTDLIPLDTLKDPLVLGGAIFIQGSVGIFEVENTDFTYLTGTIGAAVTLYQSDTVTTNSVTIDGSNYSFDREGYASPHIVFNDCECTNNLSIGSPCYSLITKTPAINLIKDSWFKHNVELAVFEAILSADFGHPLKRQNTQAVLMLATTTSTSSLGDLESPRLAALKTKYGSDLYTAPNHGTVITPRIL